MSALVLVNGDEDFLMERAVRDEISVSLSGSVQEFQVPDQLDEYLYESQAPVFGNAVRSFVLWGVTEIPALPECPGDLLVCVSKSAKKPLSDKRAKRIHNFPKLKSYSDNNEVIRWILKEGERLNIDLSRVAPALFVNCGNSLRKLASEIEKISILSSRGSVVTPDEVKGLICFSAELNPQQILDSICDGYTIKALAFYDKLQEANDETGWIIAYLQRFVIQQIKFDLLLEKKTSDSEAASKLGVHPFIYKKMLMSRQALWSRKSLLTSIDTLCELDIAHKKGDVSARFGLELEIVRLSEEAKDVKR
jgi:DNA polymerase III delta subunit